MRLSTPERAQEVMQENHFDVLPIMGNDDIVREYFKTEIWNNYDSIIREEIEYGDVIPFQTPLRTVIKSFAIEERLFYFLTNESRVTGLISVVNLNCRQVRIFVFGLISELEIRLSELIRSKMREEEILELGIKEEVKDRYFSDKERGLEPDLMEYLYLSDLINIIAKKHMYKVLGYPSRNAFEKALGPINDLRNEAAHPTRSLVSSADSANKLWNKIETVESNLFRLRQV